MRHNGIGHGLVLKGPWIQTWFHTALIGTGFLLLFFGVYEVVERAWLLENLTTNELFVFHIMRGVGAAVTVGSWAFYSTWRARQRYEEAFQEAYRKLDQEMKERTRELEEAHVFNERLFDALRDRLVVLNPGGEILKANRIAVESAGGCDPVGRSCMFSSDGACAKGADCVVRRAVDGKTPVLGELRRDPISGRIYSVDTYPVPDVDGNLSFLIQSARDITEAKRLEALLREREKQAALGVLAAGVAHDIGNPLSSMSTELELLEGETDLGRVHESVSVLRDHVARISRTLREMGNFARRRGDEVVEVDMAVAIEDALRMVRHDPRARKVRIRSEIDADLPRLRMVEDHLVLVLVNLLINAFDAMPDGGELRVGASRAEGRLRLAVTDDGQGMTEEARCRALEPLFTTKEKGRGTGLGLAVVDQVIRELDGIIEIDSKPGSGTTVRIEIPTPAGAGLKVLDV